LKINPLNGDQRRQQIDTQQVYETWRLAHQEGKRRFAGGMRWGRRNGTEYLLRKIGRIETSLGPRDADTEAAYEAFMQGRSQNKDRRASLARRLDELAPVNVAMGLGRLPLIAARILRACDASQLLGGQLIVVGTNALFAYEAAAGVHAGSALLATGDIDLLYDARRHMSLAVADVNARGLMGVLQRVDTSFSPHGRRAFRASNREGYLVDLIRPQARDVFRDRRRGGLTDLPDDLEGAAIFGLDWLINSPKFEAIVIDERGYPARMNVIDPRAFALHKAWLSSRFDRDPLKAGRDLEQARFAAAIATHYLRRSFESPDLAALPTELRQLTPAVISTENTPKSGEPNW